MGLIHMDFDHKKKLIDNGKTKAISKKREIILSCFSAVLKSVDPYNAVSSYVKNSSVFLHDKTIDMNQFKNIYVVGFGKGSIGMTQAICDSIPIKKGVAITNEQQRYVSYETVETIVGGHPVPNNNSMIGAQKVKNILNKCTSDDLVIILISGGGSALLASPRISLSDLQNTTKSLLASGATIQEINTIRKHLSTVKGGQLVQSIPCQIITFIISDVVGDPLEFIASGPTVGDSTTFTDAYDILKKYHLWNQVPESIRRVITQGKTGLIPETPFPDNPVFSQVSNVIVANNSMACKTMYSHVQRYGLKPVLLSTQLTGEARELGPNLFEKANRLFNKGQGNVFISGGEPTVTLNGNGKGGRNQEMVLSLVEALDKTSTVFASFGTDGIDGMSPAAGAIADGNSFQRAKNKDMNVEDYLKNNDSYTFFHSLQDTIITGPTGTNVMDVQILII